MWTRPIMPAVRSSGGFGPTSLLSVADGVQRHHGESKHHTKENNR